VSVLDFIIIIAGYLCTAVAGGSHSPCLDVKCERLRASYGFARSVVACRREYGPWHLPASACRRLFWSRFCTSQNVRSRNTC